MRLASFALCSVALAALVGCSSPVPAAPDAAWVVNMSSAGGMCDLMISTRMVGSVDDQNIYQRVTDQMMVTGGTAKVTCTVSGTGTFAVQGYALSGYDSLTVDIPAIDTSATMSMPAAGSVTYLSDSVETPFQGSCGFYISGKEAIGSGKAWLSFTCNGLQNAQSSPPAVCPVNQSYMAFENCLTM